MSFTFSSRLSSEINTKHRKAKTLIAVLVLFSTLVVFLPTLQNEFINWDDYDYVYDNQYIRPPLSKVPGWAFLNFYQANWHPLTWMSHALDYAVWGLTPIGHHLVNNVLHALNAFIFVFLSIGLMEYDKRLRITEGHFMSKIDNKGILAAGGAAGLLFGIHPIHVESVAWVSERKDVLSALFFCLSILSYIRYAACMENLGRAVSEFSNRYYLLTLICFICALLSKPMAVTLPAVLLILDWYPFQRVQSFRAFWTLLKEKVPFFILSIAASVLTVMAQSRGIQPLETSLLPARLLIGSNAIVSYLGKMALPFSLIPFYPYPRQASVFSLQYFLPVLAVIAITALCVIFYLRGRKIWLAVWSYYIITLLPVLGIIQVGRQSMADRYTYLPSLGPFLVAGLAVWHGYGKLDVFRKWGLRKEFTGVILAVVMLVSLSFLTVRQIGIWKNSLNFWNYIIENTPEKVPFVFCNRGVAFEIEGEYDLAMNDLDTALALKPDYPLALYSRGRVYTAKGMYDRAVEDFTGAIALDPKFPDAFNSRGIAYVKKELFDNGMRDFDRAIALKPDYYDAFSNRGLALMMQGQYEKAVESCTSAINLDANKSTAYFNRAQARLKMGERASAMADLRKGCVLGNNIACSELEKLVKN